MSEAAEFGSLVPAILLFVLWWALLAVLRVTFPPTDPAGKPAPVAGGGAALDEKPGNGGLQEAPKPKPAFDEKAFLDGAAKAYEVVLQAYAEGDTESLRPLLSADVLAAFEKAIAERRQRREIMRLTFVGLNEARIVEKAGDGEAAEITVRFAAEMVISTGFAQDGADDPGRLVQANDLWTFARGPASRDGNWLLVATEEA